MAEPTIAAGIALGLLDYAVTRGAARRDLAKRAGIDPAALQDPDARVPFSRYVTLMRVAKELCHDPALALHFGEAIDLGDLSILGSIGGGVRSIADGLALTNRYAPLVVDVDGGPATERFVIRRQGGKVWLIDTRKNPNDFPEMTESAFARIVCSSRRWSDGESFVQAVHVTHPDPGYREEYERIFQVPVTFESDKNALGTDEAWLSQRIDIPSTYTTKVLRTHADTLLGSLEAAKTTRGRVEDLLLPRLSAGGATIDRIAGELGVSRQTLFRRLRREGVTFRQVLDELRRTMALHYLTAEKLSVKETSRRLGFSEPAAFSRAFKRWTGSSPSGAATR